MNNIVHIWENKTNPTGELELTDAQLMAVNGAEDGWFPQSPQASQPPQFPQAPQASQPPQFPQPPQAPLPQQFSQNGSDDAGDRIEDQFIKILFSQFVN